MFTTVIILILILIETVMMIVIRTINNNNKLIIIIKIRLIRIPEWLMDNFLSSSSTLAVNPCSISIYSMI